MRNCENERMNSLIKTFAMAIVLQVSISVSQSLAAQKIVIPSSSTYGGNSVVLTGELHLPARTSDRKAPVVILLHGCAGLTPTVSRSLETHAATLGKHGFASLILDSFTPRGISGGWVCKKISRLASARHYRQRDISDAIKHLAKLQELDQRNIFIVGQSNGGSTATMLSNRPTHKNVRAIVAFYPWCGAVPLKPKIPVLVLSGEEDDWTPPDVCLSNHAPEKNLTVKVYPGAHHSFDLAIPVVTYQGHKVGGNKAATNDSRRRMIRFFNNHMKK